jgi:hypothetical protein
LAGETEVLGENLPKSETVFSKLMLCSFFCDAIFGSSCNRRWLLGHVLSTAKVVPNAGLKYSRVFLFSYARKSRSSSMRDPTFVGGSFVMASGISFRIAGAMCLFVVHFLYVLRGARSSVVGSGTMLQVGRSRIRFPMWSLHFTFDLILPAALWPCGRLSL